MAKFPSGLSRLSSWRPVLLRVLAFWPVVASAQAADDLRLTVAPGSELVAQGDIVRVDLSVANLTSAINGIQAFVEYDESLLSLLSVQINENVGTTWSGVIQTEPGIIQVFIVILGGSTTMDQTVTTIQFTAIAPGVADSTFMPDNPPIVNKLTNAEDSSVIVPTLHNSDPITITASTIPTVSLWGLIAMLEMQLIAATILLRNRTH